MRTVRPETPTATTLVVGVPDWPGHLAGQHVDLRLTAEDGYQAERSYSIASPPEAGGALALTVERLEDGEVSTYLSDEVRPGDVLELRGPIGGYFTWQAADGGPLVLIGGGSGVVPLAAMLRHRAAVRAEVDARLLVSARRLDDVLYRDELDGAKDGVAVRYTLTGPTPPGWDGWSRRVDAAMLRDFGPGPALGPRVYVCGPTAFVEHVADLLVAAGHDPGRVKTERFGPTGG